MTTNSTIAGAILSPPKTPGELFELTGYRAKGAADRVGGLSKPSKMPGPAYGLPAAECGVGSRLRAASTAARPTVCGDCYALKGRYVFPNVQAAQYRRLETVRAAMADPAIGAEWVAAMVAAGAWAARDCGVFRWHDSGDLQGPAHLSLLVDVADRLPWVRFWLPTREAKTVRGWVEDHGPLPANLCARISAALVGHVPDVDRAIVEGRQFSAVVRAGDLYPLPDGVELCRAPSQGGECRDCRACWDRGTVGVAYVLH